MLNLKVFLTGPGNFMQGFSEFKKKKAGWTLQRQLEDKNARRRGPELK